MFYLEERTATSSTWMPALYRDRPDIGKNMRVGTTGARARFQPVEVADEHRILSLSDISAIYTEQPQDSEGAA